MFSADNSGIIIVWGTKVVDGSGGGVSSRWSIERVKNMAGIVPKQA